MLHHGYLLLLIFMCDLFNDGVSKSDNIIEWYEGWCIISQKLCEQKHLWPNLRYLCGGTEEDHKNC